jgi:hypothetical protein
MKKFGLVLAAVAALALGSMTASQPAKADGGTILVVGGLGWGYCHVTYGQKRKTPLCAWHDAWHKQYWGKKR